MPDLQFCGPLVLGLAIGLVAGFCAGIHYWHKQLKWANQDTRTKNNESPAAESHRSR